jgi:hypothetical protein
MLTSKQTGDFVLGVRKLLKLQNIGTSVRQKITVLHVDVFI